MPTKKKDTTKPDAAQKPEKPLGGNAYGSIPHLPQSRLGPAERTIQENQAKYLTQSTANNRQTVVVVEKMDGSNVAVAALPNQPIVALGRAGYPAETSPYRQHQLFAAWVKLVERRFNMLVASVIDHTAEQRPDGEQPTVVIHGEWLAQAHGRVYQLDREPFMVFDITVNGERLPFLNVVGLCGCAGFHTPQLVHYGTAVSPEVAMKRLASGSISSKDGPEGLIYRMEIKGKVAWMAKYLPKQNKDGQYLSHDDDGNEQPRWNDNLAVYLPELREMIQS